MRLIHPYPFFLIDLEINTIDNGSEYLPIGVTLHPKVLKPAKFTFADRVLECFLTI